MTKSVDWHLNFQNEDYLRLSVQRLREDAPPLDWCVQFFDLIRRQRATASTSPIVLNDIGCNVGHFCRVLDGLGDQVQYRGFDISETYLKIARTRYPAHQFLFLDVEKDSPGERADISIISATLEHIEDWETALRNILSSTTGCVLVRSFFGDRFGSGFYKKADASRPYLIRQFTFQQVAELGSDLGFSTRFLRDQATDSIPQYLGCGVTRAQYAVMSKNGK